MVGVINSRKCFSPMRWAVFTLCNTFWPVMEQFQTNAVGKDALGGAAVHQGV